MGVAVLASVFAADGGYESAQAFTDGMVAAFPIAVVVLAAGAALALLTPPADYRAGGGRGGIAHMARGARAGAWLRRQRGVLRMSQTETTDQTRQGA
jgi:hypothetical protein